MNRQKIDSWTGEIVDSAMRVHSRLGPGLLESAYEACLAHELTRRGLRVDVQLPQPIVYEGIKLELGYPLDLLVEATVIVELKTCKAFHPVHFSQMLSYLRLSEKPVGLLINFHELHLRDGIKRFAL